MLQVFVQRLLNGGRFGNDAITKGYWSQRGRAAILIL